MLVTIGGTGIFLRSQAWIMPQKKDDTAFRLSYIKGLLYGSWIYNYLCNQWQSPVIHIGLPFNIRQVDFYVSLLIY